METFDSSGERHLDILYHPWDFDSKSGSMLRESTEGVKYENDSFYGLSCEGSTQIHHGYTACSSFPAANDQFRQPNSHHKTCTSIKVRTAVDVWLDRMQSSNQCCAKVTSSTPWVRKQINKFDDNVINRTGYKVLLIIKSLK